MNGNFKFRAFNTKDNEMYGDEVAKSILYQRSIGDNFNSHYVIMQSTGLYDKKGTELFEGDVILINGISNSKVSIIRGNEYGYLVVKKSGQTFHEHRTSEQMELYTNIHNSPHFK